jgi:hypothetical protein
VYNATLQKRRREEEERRKAAIELRKRREALRIRVAVDAALRAAAVCDAAVASRAAARAKYAAELAELDDIVSLRATNVAAHQKRAPLSMRLDSSIKKTGTCLRKLRVVSEHTAASLIKEMDKLNLTRYVEEVAAAVADTKVSRPADITKCVAVVSHQCNTVHVM